MVNFRIPASPQTPQTLQTFFHRTPVKFINGRTYFSFKNALIQPLITFYSRVITILAADPADKLFLETCNLKVLQFTLRSFGF